MIEYAEQPLIFLDVDGTVIPFGQSNGSTSEATATETYLAGINPELGRQLAALTCELVWATTWEDEANEVLAPRLGLPPLRVVHWPEPSGEGEREDRWFNLHWKTRTLVAWANGRPFAWVDDEITAADIEWIAAHHHGHALLHPVDGFLGITRQDLEALGAWLRSVS
ncbi:HAD domain-containing protein [Glycomyces tritici]|uniref:HAD domain-containing protein n=1 Tax=Glycomyces tritici TaxID=2665176 RepID=A0ABT7YM09_9ACTN|nr:HAD domain-containing protein [Glycomyces tritici]MDN3239680.1 HAD domain-containing protein [Glycomyces tritici]